MSEKSANQNIQNSPDIGVKILLENQKNQIESLLSAASLAKNLNVQLQGLLIEEENLIRAADLSLSCEVSLWSAEERHINSESIHRTMRAHARHQKKELEKVAAQKNIEYSFVVIRGEKDNWIKENIRSSDILFIGGYQLKETSFEAFKYCTKATPPLIALFNGSVASENALKIALKIAKKDKSSVQILLLADDFSAEEFQRNQLNTLLKNHADIAVTVESISKQHIASTLRRKPIKMLIAPADFALDQGQEPLVKLLHQLLCPVVLVK
ncbi:universal stress protein [Cocleimonas flava]|uniref:Universal stress protein family protein n=1 Tax=Cocleimonas flava TaxID=634765 RepID=A0A4R1F7U5_9GAMM|nr:hypothetical protein [Cocleimonas flava]TCJ88734.1 hypothetical protein EV695_0592 [Cocleimonas flava]